jgi:mannose-6-phosphate isomerase-like protein (cupin superfamily)
MSAAAIVKRMADCPAYRISPQDTNYFALLFDARGEGCDLVAVVEIFEPGGKTPPNAHQRAHEMFFVLEGQGNAICDGTTARIAKGDAMLVRPGHTHVVENTGRGKLYCLTVMVPNEDFAELIRSGTPVTLSDDDRRVLGGA